MNVEFFLARSSCLSELLRRAACSSSRMEARATFAI
jgi:hypothetical protein